MFPDGNTSYVDRPSSKGKVLRVVVVWLLHHAVTFLDYIETKLQWQDGYFTSNCG